MGLLEEIEDGGDGEGEGVGEGIEKEEWEVGG